MKDEQAQQWKAQKRAPTVLYEGEASVLGDGDFASTPEIMAALCGHKRVHIVVTALEDDES